MNALIVTALRREGLAVGGSFAVCGVGVRRARETMEQLLNRRRPAAVLNLGLAGGLDPSLAIGDVVLVQHWIHGPPANEELVAAVARALACRGVTWHDGAALTVRRALWRPEHKRGAFADHGALVCEMEGQPLAEACAAAGVPFAAVRVISDDQFAVLRRPPRMMPQLLTALWGLRRVGHALRRGLPHQG
jgi:nucleoside phosphorylase